MLSVFITIIVISSVEHYFYFAYAESIPYVVDISDEALINNSLDFNEIQIENMTNCSQILAVFAEKVTNLTRCTILNARPIQICTICKEEIQSTKEAYHRLKTESPDCRKLYFESDEIGIVNLMYTQGMDLWVESNCNDCYNNINETKEFLKVSKDLAACMKSFNKTEKPIDVCDRCEDMFVRMNDIYKKFVQRIGSDSSDGVCIDIVDQMNITRHIWSGKNCLKFDSNVGYPNIVTAVVVGCIPVFFYMLSKSVSNIEDVKLVRPKRKGYASLQSESLPAD